MWRRVFLFPFVNFQKEFEVKVKRLFLFVALMTIVALALSACSPVQAVSPSTEIPGEALDVILALALGFASLVGVSKLVAVLVQFGKLIGWVKDNTSGKWAASLNLLAFGALVYFGVFQPQLALSALDGYAAQCAEILLFLLGLFVQVTGSKPAYDALKSSNVPLLNYSHTKRNA